ncbi:DUF551 domain-containing protein [Cronobacter dublinensis]
MSTISNERLESLQRQFKEEGFNDISDSEIMQLVEENLALRKEREQAEPVAWLVCGSKTFRDRTASTREVAEQAVKDRKDGSSIKPLYTAPPAPPAADDSLPHDPQIAEYEQMMEAEQTQADTTSQQFESLASVKQQSSKDAATSKASRDSDANSSPDSQTTIKQSDGWISCSERMPETNDHFMVTGDSFDHDLAFWNGKEWSDLDYYSEVTHWMPLPAPPAE